MIIRYADLGQPSPIRSAPMFYERVSVRSTLGEVEPALKKLVSADHAGRAPRCIIGIRAMRKGQPLDLRVFDQRNCRDKMAVRSRWEGQRLSKEKSKSVETFPANALPEHRERLQFMA